MPMSVLGRLVLSCPWARHDAVIAGALYGPEWRRLAESAAGTGPHDRQRRLGACRRYAGVGSTIHLIPRAKRLNNLLPAELGDGLARDERRGDDVGVVLPPSFV